MLDPFGFVLCSLATGYLAHVIVNTDGILNSFTWIRKHDRSKVTHCQFCIAFWIAAGCILLAGLPLTLVNVLAVAGLGLMASSWTGLKHL